MYKKFQVFLGLLLISFSFLVVATSSIKITTATTENSINVNVIGSYSSKDQDLFMGQLGLEKQFKIQPYSFEKNSISSNQSINLIHNFYYNRRQLYSKPFTGNSTAPTIRVFFYSIPFDK
jgi:hypothetical protein